MAKKAKRSGKDAEAAADGQTSAAALEAESKSKHRRRDGLQTVLAPPQSVKIVNVTVPAGETPVKNIISDPLGPPTIFDMTAGNMTVTGNCLNLIGDVNGMFVGLDTNLTILQSGFTVYTGAGSRRWSLTIPGTPQPVGGTFAVVLQVCFTTGGPTDSVSFSVILPTAGGPIVPPPPPPPPISRRSAS